MLARRARKSIQGVHSLLAHSKSDRIFLKRKKFEHAEGPPHAKAAAAKFAHLPQFILSSVANELVRKHQRTEDALDLLPLRLVTRRFTPAITRAIFHTSKVLMNQLYTDIRKPRREPPWTLRRHFLNAMIFPWARGSVRDLTCMSRLVKGEQPDRAIHNNMLVLDNTSTTIRRLQLDADMRDSVLIDTRLSRLLPKAFESLHVLVLDAAFLFLLFSILDSAPKVRSLCLQGGRRVPFNVELVNEIMANEDDHQTSPERPALRVLRVDDVRYLDFEFLQRSHLRAKHVQLKLVRPLYRGHPSTAHVVEAIQDWPLFQECEKITLLNSDLGSGRLEIFQPLALNMLAETVRSEQ